MGRQKDERKKAVNAAAEKFVREHSPAKTAERFEVLFEKLLA